MKVNLWSTAAQGKPAGRRGDLESVRGEDGEHPAANNHLRIHLRQGRASALGGRLVFLDDHVFSLFQVLLLQFQELPLDFLPLHL